MNGHGTRPYRRAGRHPGRDSAELIVLHARCTRHLAIAARADPAGRGSAVVRCLVNPVTLCGSRGVSFAAASGQIRGSGANNVKVTFRS
jgi:hypothetical protein